MTNDLMNAAVNGHAAANLGYLAKDCPHLATSSMWAAWLYGFGLGCNNAPIDAVKKISQSRGYTLRVVTRGGETLIVPFPATRTSAVFGVLPVNI
jgi:hypothetical protein